MAYFASNGVYFHDFPSDYLSLFCLTWTDMQRMSWVFWAGREVSSQATRSAVTYRSYQSAIRTSRLVLTPSLQHIVPQGLYVLLSDDLSTTQSYLEIIMPAIFIGQPSQVVGLVLFKVNMPALLWFVSDERSPVSVHCGCNSRCFTNSAWEKDLKGREDGLSGQWCSVNKISYKENLLKLAVRCRRKRLPSTSVIKCSGFDCNTSNPTADWDEWAACRQR